MADAAISEIVEKFMARGRIDGVEPTEVVYVVTDSGLAEQIVCRSPRPDASAGSQARRVVVVSGTGHVVVHGPPGSPAFPRTHLTMIFDYDQRRMRTTRLSDTAMDMEALGVVMRI